MHPVLNSALCELHSCALTDTDKWSHTVWLDQHVFSSYMISSYRPWLSALHWFILFFIHPISFNLWGYFLRYGERPKAPTPLTFPHRSQSLPTILFINPISCTCRARLPAPDADAAIQLYLNACRSTFCFLPYPRRSTVAVRRCLLRSVVLCEAGLATLRGASPPQPQRKPAVESFLMWKSLYRLEETC